MMRKALVAAVTIAALFAVVSVASADHSWSGYHWPSNNLSPSVVDKTSSPLYDVPAGVQEWAFLEDGITPRSPIQPTLTGASKGDIAVTEAFSPFWLGLARIFLDDGGHITKGEVKLNTRLLNSYPAAAADHVLCQEIGHVLGLDHNRVGDSSPLDDTCMNDQVNLFAVQYTTPNQHDTDQLNLIYNGHIDSTGGDEGGGGGCPPGKPDHPKCSGASGRWITVHVFWAE